MKSVSAGEYTAPPAHGPMIAEICGTTPEASVLRRKMSAYPASETTPSWILAPPESFSPMIGTPVFIARSITLQILREYASERDPPKTVKSWANTKAGRPWIRPDPVTTPSPGIFCFCISKSWVWCTTNLSISVKEPEPLARGLLSGLVLPADPILAAGELGLHVAPTKLVELILRAHQAPSFIDFRSVFHQ